MHKKTEASLILWLIFLMIFALISCEVKEEPANPDDDSVGEENDIDLSETPSDEENDGDNLREEEGADPESPSNKEVLYTVNFDLGYGDLVNIAETSGKLCEPSVPKRYGYKFLGWYFENSLWDFNNTVSHDMILLAKWEIISFKITYVLGDAANNVNNPTTFTVETKSLELFRPTSDTLMFDGWYLDANFSEPFELNEPYSDLTLYAKFIYPSPNLLYEKLDNAYYVKGYTGNEQTILIPDTYLGLPIVGILDNAFSDVEARRVILPNTLKYISKNAFSSCNGLQFSEYGGAFYVESVNNKYFALISAIDSMAEEIDVNEDCIIVGDSSLSLSTLKTVTGAESVKYVGKFAFKNARSLEDIDIFDTVVEIGEGAFYSCRKLTSVIFSDALNSLGKEAFVYCEELETLELPRKLVAIPDYAFAYCHSLEKIVLGDSLEFIGANAFRELSVTANIYYRGTAEEFGKIQLNSNFEMNVGFIYFNYV